MKSPKKCHVSNHWEVGVGGLADSHRASREAAAGAAKAVAHSKEEIRHQQVQRFRAFMLAAMRACSGGPRPSVFVSRKVLDPLGVAVMDDERKSEAASVHAAGIDGGELGRPMAENLALKIDDPPVPGRGLPDMHGEGWVVLRTHLTVWWDQHVSSSCRRGRTIGRRCFLRATPLHRTPRPPR